LVIIPESLPSSRTRSRPTPGGESLSRASRREQTTTPALSNVLIAARRARRKAWLAGVLTALPVPQSDDGARGSLLSKLAVHPLLVGVRGSSHRGKHRKALAQRDHLLDGRDLGAPAHDLGAELVVVTEGLDLLGEAVDLMKENEAFVTNVRQGKLGFRRKRMGSRNGHE
jgi:hypothetical protein